jgi:sec-independent protein translocase protein TatB
MPLHAIFCSSLVLLAPVAGASRPVLLATLGIPDTLFLVVIALVIFGPKKLPEISRQVGKLLYEFRKASNDFKFQIEEELRVAEQAERQKELTAQAATSQPATPIAITAGETVSAEPVAETPQVVETENPETSNPKISGELTVQPPATGTPVSTQSPYRPVENAEGAAEVTAAGQSLDEPRAIDDAASLDELQADAQEAVRSAAADPSYKQPGAYNQSGDAVPTHHG